MIDGFAKEHLQQSRELFDHISKLDFESGDYFCFKSGGDGDNGEVLMDYFDDFFAKNNQTGGEVGMTKSEVKNALDVITEMSDKEIAVNSDYIRKVAEEAYALIKNLERR